MPRGFVVIGPKRQITIPKAIMDYLHLKVGDLVRFSVENGCIVMEPVKIVPKRRRNKK